VCGAEEFSNDHSGRITGPAPARGETMALSVLAEKLIPKSHRKCQPPEFRTEWKFASTWDVRDPRHSEPRLSRFKNSHEVDLLGPVHCAISACRDMVFVAAAFRRAGYDYLQDRWCQATQNEHLRKKGGGVPPVANGLSSPLRRSRIGGLQKFGGRN
jgi:hypothetical protein